MNVWLLAARPKTLPAAVVPVAVGSAVAATLGGFQWVPALAALGVALFVQIGTNFANDVFDFEKGADTESRVGPTRAVQAGLLSAGQMRRGMFVAFALTAACGLYLGALAGWPLILIGAVSILSGIAYTGGPFPLGYHGLGDIFVMVFFGFVAVCGTVYVQMLALPPLAWWAAVPVGALSTAILVVNNVRDRHTDIDAGKRTLPARFGRRFGELEYLGLLLVAFAVPVVLWRNGGEPWILLPLLTLPLAARLWVQLRGWEGAALNATLAGTAKLLLVFGGLFALGLILG